MFSNLRQGTPLYVLHKSEPRLEIAEVISCSEMQPMYNTAYQGGMLQPPKTFVDVKAKIDGQIVDFQKLPSELSIADSNGMVLSETKESIINEIYALSKLSKSVLDSVGHHQNVVERCEKLLEELNPEIRKEAERTKELNSLKEEMGNIKEMLSKLLNSKSKSKEE